MLHENNDLQDLIERVKQVTPRLELIAENASHANVKVVDQLNQVTVSRSVATLEGHCNELEQRLERLRQIRRSA